MTTEDLQGKFQEIIETTIDKEILLKMGIRDRMSAMAKLGQELIRNGISNVFVAAVITYSLALFLCSSWRVERG